MSLLVIRAAEIRELLPMRECIEVMDQAMRAFSTGRVNVPARIIEPLYDDAGHFILMPGEMQHPAVYGAKILGQQPGNPAQGRPAVQGFVTLFDRNSGAPVALMDGAEITTLRTAAASALATRELALPDAASHGIFGTGVQAASHLQAINEVRNIGSVLVWGRDDAKAEKFAARHSTPDGPRVRAVTDPAQAAACDVISVVTNSPVPVLSGAWLHAGAHVNLVGAHAADHREADSEAMARAAIYVDSRQGAFSEAGDILIPLAAGLIREADIMGELGEVLTGEVAGRQNRRQITLYKSLGNVVQDLFAAEHILRRAQSLGAGQLVDFP